MCGICCEVNSFFGGGLTELHFCEGRVWVFMLPLGEEASVLPSMLPLLLRQRGGGQPSPPARWGGGAHRHPRPGAPGQSRQSRHLPLVSKTNVFYFLCSAWPSFRYSGYLPIKFRSDFFDRVATSTGLYRSYAALVSFSGAFDLIFLSS